MPYTRHMTSQTVGVVPVWTLADRLRKAREYAGMEQGQLADTMGISRNTVSAAERGLAQPRRLTVRAWAMATGVAREWLETGEAPNPQDSGPVAHPEGFEPPTFWSELAGAGLVAVA